MSQHDKIIKTLSVINEDLIAQNFTGTRLYQLVEDHEDPAAQLLGDLPTDIPVDLVAGYDAGMRIAETTHGLVTTAMVSRHLTIGEIIERNPSMRDRFKTSVETLVGRPLEESEVDEAVAGFYVNNVLPTLPLPQQLPPAMRCTARLTLAVLRNGDLIGVVNQEDKKFNEIHVKVIEGGEHVPVSMFLFLHAVRPRECDDPITLVQDAKTLEALSSLPTFGED